MAKKAVIEREKKRIKLVAKYKEQREELKSELIILRKDYHANFEKIESLTKKLAKAFPRNAVPSRIRNRCAITGRPRGYYRKFGLGRNQLRKRAMEGDITGLVKSSW